MQVFLVSGIALACLVIGFILGMLYAKITIHGRYARLEEKSKWATSTKSQ